MKILNVGTRTVNRYLLVLPNGYCLIDTGYKWEYDKFLSSLKSFGVKKEDIKYVVITHAHSEHVGFLRQLIRDVKPTVIFHPGQKNRLEAGKNNTDVYVSTLGSYFTVLLQSTFVDKYQCFPSVKTASFVSYEDNPLADYGIEFIPLKGHTDADLAVKAGSDLFCGDICASIDPTSKRFPMRLENKFELIKSWEKLVSDREIATIYPGHGKPFDAKELKTNLEYWRSKGVFKLYKKKKNQI